MIKQMKQWIRNNKSYIRYLNRTNPNIMTFILYGLLFDTVVNMWKPFGVKFLQRLGGDETHIALFNALPGIVAAICLLPSSMIIAQLKQKKRATSVFFLLSRCMLLLVVFVPFVPEALRPMLFVILISLMNFPDAVSQTSLQSFLGEVFDGRVRGQAISLRIKFGNLVVPFVTLLTGFIISYLPVNDQQRIMYYQIFFAAAFVVGMIEVAVFNRFKTSEPDPSALQAPAKDSPYKLDPSVIKTIIKDKKFTSFLSTAILFTFFWQAGWSLCSIYNIQTLGATEIWLAMFTVATCISSFLSAGFWNKQIVKKGNNLVLVLSTLLVAIHAMLFPLTPNLIVMCFVSAFSGFALLGLNTSMLNGLLGVTPDQDRMVYIGVYNTCANFSLFLSPLFSLIMLKVLGDNIRAALWLIALGRLISSGVMYLNYLRNKKANA